ncbi:MAG: hypothetical protein JWR69_2420 [Pedosphaera sp.]|nr:hypothetical protein [Pedosphaera sp.]
MIQIISLCRRVWGVLGWASLFVVCFAQPLVARDVFVMLSGGNSPMDNNYSQYLQAKAVSTYFEQHYPRDSVWVFFGAGNVEGEKPIFGDVHREVTRDGVTVDSWLAGSIRGNLPARREIILRKFREEILPAVADGGTLFLFVGDHGSRTRGRAGESFIDLWSLERDSGSEHGWRANDDESLGVAEFRRTLARGLGKGRVVFCMTQCHSGGFHYLAVPHEMTLNPKWYSVKRNWPAAKEAPVLARAAGFTATDEFSMASGCDPDPDPANWDGYERFVPENLFGVNLLTQQRIGPPLRSFAEAHVAATLEDGSIDKPYSTSEQYLERWANLIETRLMKEPNLTDKVKRSLVAYRHTVDGGEPQVPDAAFSERQAVFRRFVESLSEQDPVEKSFLLTGSRRRLEEVIGTSGPKGLMAEDPAPAPQSNGPAQRPTRRRGSQEARKLWKETVRPAWKAAIAAHEVTPVPVAALEFEKYLLRQEDAGRNFLSANASSSALQREVFWQSGYSDPATVNLTKAEAVARWGAERRSKILAWAKTSEDEAVRAAAAKLLERQTRLQLMAEPAARSAKDGPEPVSEKTAAARTLFYRRVLAAWEFLYNVKETPALSRLHELNELERIPLPRPKS